MGVMAGDGFRFLSVNIGASKSENDCTFGGDYER